MAGKAGHGPAWRGKAWLGEVWQAAIKKNRKGLTSVSPFYFGQRLRLGGAFSFVGFNG